MCRPSKTWMGRPSGDGSFSGSPPSACPRPSWAWSRRRRVKLADTADQDIVLRERGSITREVFEQTLAAAGIPRSDAYVTNVVKHFKFTRRGKARIHQKPNAAEQAACRPWLEAELEVVRPEVVVCLGATAAQSLLGRSFRVTRQRGQFVEWPYEPLALATVHPSSILRAPEDADRKALMAGFVADLEVVTTALGG